jgi:hypothetical protein
MPLEPANPYHGHAVRNGNGGIGVSICQLSIALSLHDTVNIDRGEITFPPASKNAGNLRQSAVHRQSINPYAQNVY